MNQLRGDFYQWLEDEATLVHTRVRQSEKFGIAFMIAVQQQIEIYRARPVFHFANAAEKKLDPQQPRHYLFRCWQGISNLGNHVEKWRLLDFADRFCLVNRRQATDTQRSFHHPAHTKQQVAGAVAEI